MERLRQQRAATGGQKGEGKGSSSFHGTGSAEVPAPDFVFPASLGEEDSGGEALLPGPTGGVASVASPGGAEASAAQAQTGAGEGESGGTPPAASLPPVPVQKDSATMLQKQVTNRCV